MAIKHLEELASQAEREGVTLAEVISREFSPREIDEMQAELEEKLSENYGNIEAYMSGVEVPSIDELLSLGDEKLLHMLGEPVIISSDETTCD